MKEEAALQSRTGRILTQKTTAYTQIQRASSNTGMVRSLRRLVRTAGIKISHVGMSKTVTKLLLVLFVTNSMRLINYEYKAPMILRRKLEIRAKLYVRCNKCGKPLEVKQNDESITTLWVYPCGNCMTASHLEGNELIGRVQ